MAGTGRVCEGWCTTTEYLEFANWFAGVAGQVGDERLAAIDAEPPMGPAHDHWRQRIDELLSQFDSLNDAATALRSSDAIETIALVNSELLRVQQATSDAQSIVAHIADIGQALEFVAKFVTLAVAVAGAVAAPEAGIPALIGAGSALASAVTDSVAAHPDRASAHQPAVVPVPATLAVTVAIMETSFDVADPQDGDGTAPDPVTCTSGGAGAE